MFLQLKITNPTVAFFYITAFQKQKMVKDKYFGNQYQLFRLSQDAGFDVYCPEDVTITPGQTYFLNLGIACQALTDAHKPHLTPDYGQRHVGDPTGFYIYPRSSISKTPLRLANCMGIIDAGYRGDLMLALDNIKSESYTIKAGQRLAQICAPNLEHIDFEIVKELSTTKRGSEGMGSTGT